MPGQFSSKFICRSKLLVMLFLSFGQSLAFAQKQVSETAATVVKKQPVPPANSHALTVSFVSWQEQLTITDGALTEEVLANIFGNAISYSYQNYFAVRHGSVIELGLFNGNANQGGAQANIGYTPTQISCLGFWASYRYAFRLTKSATMSFGPYALARQLTWPSDPAGGTAEAKSGAGTNFGALIELEMRLCEAWFLEQRIANMTAKATTLWSLGLGYKF